MWVLLPRAPLGAPHRVGIGKNAFLFGWKQITACRGEVYDKNYPVLPPKKGCSCFTCWRGVGNTQRCYYAPNMEDMGVKNTSWARFSLKLRMLGVAPGASRGCFRGARAQFEFSDGWYKVEPEHLL